MLVRKALLLSLVAAGAALLVAAAPKAPALPAAAETYSIDHVHSSAVFRIKHLNVSYFYGTFEEVRGTITFDAANPASSSIDAQIPVEKVDTRNSKRNDHLKSADFFNSAKFPTITFKSKSFAKSGENTFDVTGDLTLHGVTKPLTFKLEKTGEANTSQGSLIGFETTFTVKRSDFGITFMPDGLGDDVRLTISVEAKK